MKQEEKQTGCKCELARKICIKPSPPNGGNQLQVLLSLFIFPNKNDMILSQTAKGNRYVT